MQNIIKTYKSYKVLNYHKLNTLYNDKEPNKYYYIYRITNVEENKHYYGCRVSYILPSIDLGNKYISSSSDITFKEEQILNKEKFKYKVVKIFNNNNDKILYECFLHQYFDVKNHNSFYNLCNATPTGFDTTGLVACLDTLTGEYTLVRKEEFRLNPYLVGYSAGMVTCRNVLTNATLRVTKEEFDSNPNLSGISTLKVACIDNITNERKYVSVEEFYSDSSLISHNADLVVCKYKGTNEIIRVTKEEFDSTPELVGTTYGVELEFTDEHRKNMSIAMTGKPKSESHRKNLSLANIGKVACKRLGSKEIIFVSQEEFDNDPNLVGTTKNTDIYTIKLPDNNIIRLIGKSEFFKFCSSNELSIPSLLTSLRLNIPVEDSRLFYKKSFNIKIKNAVGYQLISIEEF